ncbi:uncharacterized protein LOC113851224 [Abrus precatorius]|uniref:Uncharacterized protein LOC113851224 n=1 Tax=Abrus precatorius TaxID=3816 RepID=A0A8B8K1H4_ABRPR|nr:uncharacterized protein LOC113851224 [Abrus precatorius]
MPKIGNPNSIVKLSKSLAFGETVDCEQLTNIIADERVNEELKEEIVDGENDNKSCDSIICSKNYSTTLPPLKEFELFGCSQSCPKLSFTSTLESDQLERAVLENICRDIAQDLLYSIIQDPSNECQTTKITEDIQGELEVQATSQSELASSEVNTNQSIAEIKHEIVEEDSSLKIPSATTSPIKWHEHIQIVPKKKQDQSNQEDCVSKQIITTTLSMDSEKGKTSPRQLLSLIQEDILRNFEVGTTSANAVIVALPHYGRTFFDEQPMEEHTSMKEQQALGETDIIFEVFQGNNGMPPPNYGIKRNVEGGNASANFESITSSTRSELVSSSLGPSVASKGETCPHEHGDGQMAIPSVLVVPPSAQETSEIALALTNSHGPVPLNGDASMKVSSIVEELFLNNDGIGVSDSKPFPGISSQSPSQTMDDVSFGSLVKSELEQLRRALFPSLQVYEEALQKLLDSKRILTQHVKDLKHQVASSEAVLESIIPHEAQVMEARASLSAPLGYWTGEARVEVPFPLCHAAAYLGIDLDPPPGRLDE